MAEWDGIFAEHNRIELPALDQFVRRPAVRGARGKGAGVLLNLVVTNGAYRRPRRLHHRRQVQQPGTDRARRSPPQAGTIDDVEFDPPVERVARVVGAEPDDVPAEPTAAHRDAARREARHDGLEPLFTNCARIVDKRSFSGSSCGWRGP